jgi:rhamnogalacturonan endolyase
VVYPGRRQAGGTRVGKWQGATLRTGIEGPLLQIADILGDWREELITFADGELRLYSTTIRASDRRPCLMQDPIYRHDVTHRSMGYAHTPQLGTYLDST